MANGDPKVRRTLHLKMTVPTADPAHLLPMVQAAMPFYEFFGGTRVRLRGTMKKGRVEIFFFSPEELDRLCVIMFGGR